MKISARAYRIIAKLILAIVVVVLVGVIAFVALQISGKNRLYKQNNSTGPDLSRVVLTESTEAMESTESTEVSSEEVVDESTWQEGDIRYQGVHYRYNQDVLTFLFLGIDKMEEVTPAKDGTDGGQSDALFLLVLNPNSMEANVIGIPRDTMADVEVYNEDGNYVGNAMAQITLQHAYGDGMHLSCERTVDAVSRLFYNLPIHGYCAVNMGAIPLINDAVGGVEVTALEDVIKTDIKEGQTILLKGKDAYYYLHNRDTKSVGSAARRLERQKQYLHAYASTTLKAMKEDITIPVDIYNTISKYMVTDITVDEVSYLATQALSYQFGEGSITSLSGEIENDGKFSKFYVDEVALYELIIDVFYEEVN